MRSPIPQDIPSPAMVGVGSASAAPPVSPTFLRTTNSFSAAVRRLISSSYLQGDKGKEVLDQTLGSRTGVQVGLHHDLDLGWHLQISLLGSVQLKCVRCPFLKRQKGHF